MTILLIRPLFVLFTLVATTLGSCSQNEDEIEVKEIVADQKPSEFNKELAKKLGADEYGMKSYVMAFLKSGPSRGQDAETAEALQAAHMANIGKMADEGVLVFAGPFLDGGDLRGIYLFDVETVEEAEALTATDPAIQAGRLIMELHPWYGSAALMQVSEVHDQLTKTPM